MSYKVEDLGKNMVKLTINTSPEEFENALERAYQKNKKKINVQGFRKGKAPRSIIEKLYGVEIFYEDAANDLVPIIYDKVATESELELVSRPEIDIEQIEKGKEFIFTAKVAVKPEVILGQYKGIEIEKIKVEVTEEEIIAELDRVREQNARTITIEDRPVEDGDIVNLNYEGFVDGIAFPGGKAENHNLVIGSHSFIDTFEEQLIGKQVGEEADICVTFPEPYHSEELKGKAAVFKIRVNEIKKKELPELDDDFAQDVSEFDSLEEYKSDIRATILKDKEKDAISKKEDAIVEKIIEKATMDIPEPMIDNYKRQMADEFSQRVQAQGLSLEQYFKFTGLTPNKFMEDLAPQAVRRIQFRLVLEAVAKAEDIQIDEEQLDKEIESMAKQYKMDLEKMKEIVSESEKEQIKLDLAVQKAIDIIRDSAVEI